MILIYVPVLPGIPRDYPCYPNAFGLEYEDVWLTAADGTRLNAWLIWPRHWTAPAQQRKQRPVVMFFQENAGNMAFRLHFIKAMTRVLDCSVFILSYRGYGRSTGSPSEKGLKLDADAAVEHLTTRDDVDGAKVIMFGKSLGGAVAIHAAAKHKHRIKGLIVENTFRNLEDTAGHTMPFLRPLLGTGRPCNWLLRNKWYNDRIVVDIADLPVLFLSSQADEVLPPVHMEDLYSKHGAQPWSFVQFEGARHMDCYETHAPMYWPAVGEFVSRLFQGNNQDDGGVDDSGTGAAYVDSPSRLN